VGECAGHVGPRDGVAAPHEARHISCLPFLTRASTCRVYCTLPRLLLLDAKRNRPTSQDPTGGLRGVALSAAAQDTRPCGPVPSVRGGLQYTMQTSSGLRQHRLGPIKVSRDWLEHPPDGRHVASWGTVGFTCGSRMLSPLCEGTSHLAQQYSGGQDARA
jgi:hypothetical protein